MELTIVCKSEINNPSSIIKLAVKYLGTAPLTARSLTVPATASLPIFPPGKKSGLMTKLSVETAIFDDVNLMHAESSLASCWLPKA